jgi:hypothetical protein
VVRAALLLTRSGGPVAGLADLEALVGRLRPALGLGEHEAGEWRDALAPLLAPAAEQYWSVEARLLYELQKVAVDHERELYAVDLVEWALWLGSRPLRRPLPLARLVLQLGHLRKADRLLDKARVADEHRGRLHRLLDAAVAGAEERVRAAVEEGAGAALDAVGLRPADPAERVARAKVAAELADKVLAWGFLTFSDVRDTLARNQLKLADLEDPGELLTGDQLLRLDRQLAVRLDGVYRRAEFYLRWLQTFTSLGFGTPWGRFVTRYFTLPVGGAFVILEFLQHLLHHLPWFDAGLSPEEHDAVGAVAPLAGLAERHAPELVAPESVLALALVLFALLHFHRVRRWSWWVLRQVARALGWTFYTLPARLILLPAVRWFLATAPVRFFRRRLMEATLLGILALVAALLARQPLLNVSVYAVLGFCGGGVLFNTRPGRAIREEVSRALAELHAFLWYDLLLGAYQALLGAFRWVAAWFERLLYRIDEKVRFRAGGGRLVFAAKLVLGVAWFAVHYVVRFVFVVLVEPQFNPVKHFPTVTVAHKLLLPTIPVVAGVLEQTMERAAALTAAPLLVGSVPGLFGFLVWELKENWKLYRANRPAELAAVRMGAHGERVVELMRPGLHTGTLPALFGRWRTAERGGRARSRARALAGLHHAEQAFRHFVDREVVGLLGSSPGWGGVPLRVAHVRLAIKRVEVELASPGLGDPVVLAFEELSGWLGVRVSEGGWLERLEAPQRERLATALAGLYKWAGVSVVHEELTARWHGRAVVYAVTPGGLLAWDEARPERPVRYAWARLGMVAPLDEAGNDAGGEWPLLPAEALDYRLVRLSWADWVDTWQREERGEDPLPLPREPVRVLPGD